MNKSNKRTCISRNLNFRLRLQCRIYIKVHPLFTANTEQCTLASGEDPDKMPHYAVFHQDLHCLHAISSGSALFAMINTMFRD